jgi:ankyrin repeat protein
MIAALLSAATLAAAETDTHLVEAAQRGDATAVAELLKPGADADAAAPDGATALHWAAHLDKLKLAGRLVRAGANANAANRYGVTPLMLACTNGNAAMLELLLNAGADPNIAMLGAGETPLMIAARTGKTPAIRTLLAHGAKPNSPENSRGQTALMWAAADGHVGAVQTLIKFGADVNARSRGGFTAFLFAVRQGQTGVVQALLKADADVNQALPGKRGRRDAAPAETTGTSALGLAIGNAHYELAAMLLDAGAHPNGVRKDRTPLHTITWVRKPGIGSNAPAPRGSGRMNSLEFVRKLAEHGADLNARMTTRRGGARTALNMQGATPFLLAARTGDAELMRLLVELGADPLIPNKDNTTPLMVAAGIGVHAPSEDPGTESEVVEAVKVALALGNDVNSVDDRGNTAMHGAAYKHVPAVVALLVESGAKIEVWNKKNKSGWTPLRIATGVHRGLNYRSSPKTAAAIRKVMIAAGVSTVVEPEKNIRGVTN